MEIRDQEAAAPQVLQEMEEGEIRELITAPFHEGKIDEWDEVSARKTERVEYSEANAMLRGLLNISDTHHLSQEVLKDVEVLEFDEQNDDDVSEIEQIHIVDGEVVASPVQIPEKVADEEEVDTRQSSVSYLLYLFSLVILLCDSWY